MVIRFIAIASFALAATLRAAPPADTPVQERTFDTVVLYGDDGGRIWLGLPVVHLGMVGVEDLPPLILSPDAARQVEPLVTHLAETPKYHSPWWFSMPRARGREPVIMLGVQLQMAPARDADAISASRPAGEREAQTVASIRILHVECVPCEWHDAWETANVALKRIVKLSKDAPGAEKKRRLAEAIHNTAAALTVMHHASADTAWVERARRAAPDARVIRSYQRERTGEWQAVLEERARRLRIAVDPPLPPRGERFDGPALLAECDSPKDFMTKIAQAGPDDLLEERLIYSPSFRRTVYAREVDTMTPDQYGKLHAEAQSQLASRKKRLDEEAARSQPTTRPVDGLHIAIRLAEPDLLADKLVLAGVIVDKTLDDGPTADLRPGDLIAEYAAMAMAPLSPLDLERTAVALAQTARYGGELRVFRGDQAITIGLPRPAAPATR